MCMSGQDGKNLHTYQYLRSPMYHVRRYRDLFKGGDSCICDMDCFNVTCYSIQCSRKQHAQHACSGVVVLELPDQPSNFLVELEKSSEFVTMSLTDVIAGLKER